MGCGISRSDPKEAVEATPNFPHHYTKSTTSNCFTGESKPNLPEDPIPKPHPHHHPSSPHRDKVAVSMTIAMQREIEEHNDKKLRDHEEDDEDSREICRGGSPSFREYCIDSESKSRSMRSEDDDECEGGMCKWPNERTLNSEKEKGLEKREGIGKGIKKALHSGRSGGVRNFLSASRRQQHHQPNTNNFPDNSQKRLLAKAS